MSGLMAAHQLQAHGVNVTLLDKGRGVGGRLATRWTETPGGARGYFDHGAQFFTVRDSRFQALVDEWLAAGLVREWSKGFPQTLDDTNDDGHPRYCGAAGMNAIARHLAQGLDVRLNAQVERLACDERQWHAQLTNGETFSAEALILTPPVPQSLALLAAFTPQWPASTLQALTDITYDPCFAVLAVLAAPSHLPAPGAMQIRQEPIAWLADNQRKGISPAIPTVTIHAGPEFTRAHWDTPYDTVAQLLIEAASPWLGASVTSWQVQRWRYSQPQQLYPAPCLVVNQMPPLVLAGDGFGAARVEGAALSGLAAADALFAGLN
ncbi:MAG: FAD-dependent oxidoreductase [Acidobacteria bacterium]|nr:FAD-dependent oxidoreductase [Acidobacteriota bacterium]